MRAAKLWLATAAALLMAGLAVADAFAAEPGLKLPPSVAAPPATAQAPANPVPPAKGEADTPQFFLVPATTMERVSQAIERAHRALELQQREILRLRAIADKGSCS